MTYIAMKTDIKRRYIMTVIDNYSLKQIAVFCSQRYNYWLTLYSECLPLAATQSRTWQHEGRT